jgi:hypothetical protein
MEELLKFAIEGGSFGISLFLIYILFKRFVKKEIVEPIEELQEDHKQLKRSFTRFSETASDMTFKVVNSHTQMVDIVTKTTSNMYNLFAEATRHTSQAKVESHEALNKVNVLEATTDKLLKISTAVHEKNKSIETEVHKLSNDLIMIKNKVGIKKDES